MFCCGVAQKNRGAYQIPIIPKINLDVKLSKNFLIRNSPWNSFFVCHLIRDVNTSDSINYNSNVGFSASLNFDGIEKWFEIVVQYLSMDFVVQIR